MRRRPMATPSKPEPALWEEALACILFPVLLVVVYVLLILIAA